MLPSSLLEGVKKFKKIRTSLKIRILKEKLSVIFLGVILNRLHKYDRDPFQGLYHVCAIATRYKILILFSNSLRKKVLTSLFCYITN